MKEISPVFSVLSQVSGIIFMIVVILTAIYLAVQWAAPGFWLERFGEKGFKFWVVIIPFVGAVSGTLAIAPFLFKAVLAQFGGGE